MENGRAAIAYTSLDCRSRVIFENAPRLAGTRRREWLTEMEVQALYCVDRPTADSTSLRHETEAGAHQRL